MEALAVLLLLVAGLSLVGMFVAIAGDAIGWWSADASPIVCGSAFVVCLVLGLILAMPSMAAHDEELMKQCMQDHKEYECVSMLRRKSSNTTVVPVVVPVR